MDHLPIVVAALTGFFLVSFSLYTCFVCIHMHKRGSASALTLLRKDRHLKLARYFIFFFFVVSLAIAVGMTSGYSREIDALFWALLFIGAICIARRYLIRLVKYTEGSFVFAKTLVCIGDACRDGDDKKAASWADSLVEAAGKAIHKGELQTASLALTTLLQSVDLFIQKASKYPAHNDVPLFERVRYFSIFLCRRLEWLLEIAIRENVAPISEEIISTYGKMALHFSKHHPQLAHVPLLSLGKENIQAMAHTQMMLSELAKSFIMLSKEHNQSLKELIVRTIKQLEANAKANFQKNKSESIAFHMQPFAEIADLFTGNDFAEVIDREEILAELRRILQELSSLELILKQANS